MERWRWMGSYAGACCAAGWFALALALEACGGHTGDGGKEPAQQTGGVDTGGGAGGDTVRAPSGGSGASAAGGTGGAMTGGSSPGGAATGGGGTTATGATGTASGGTSSSAAAGASASSATGGKTEQGAAGAASGGASAQAGTGGTGGKASGGSGGTLAGGAGTAAGGTSSSAAAAGSAGAAASSPVDALVGTWEGGGYVGNCINERQFLTFEEPDQVSYADWNDDACSGPKLMSEKAGTFVVSGQHTLEIAWDLSDDPQYEPTVRCVEEYPFATGASTRGTAGIVRDLFIPVDDRTWQYRTVDRCYDVDDVVLEGTLIDLEISLDAPLPLTGSGDCRMTVSAEVVRESQTADDNGSYAADLYVVPCVVEPEDGKQHVRFARFVGAEPADEYQIWLDFLDEQGYQEAHPDWVLALLNGVFFPDLTLDPTDPTYLCEYGCTTEWVASEGMTGI